MDFHNYKNNFNYSFMIGIIVNPYAGGGMSIKKLPYIKEYLDEKKLKYEIAITEDKERGKEKFYGFLEKYERIVFVGGDGTLNNSVQIGTKKRIDKIIGMIPTGSGNDFIRGLYEKKLNFKEYMEIAFFGKEKYVDAGILEKENEKIIFLNGCGFGIDSETAVKSEELRIFKGILRYLISLLIVLKNFKPIYVKIKTENFEYEGKITLIAFGNGKYIGGGFKLTPFADPFDGKIDFSIIKELSKFKILKELPKAVSGKHIYESYSIYKNFSNFFEIEIKKPYNFHLDGEVYKIGEGKVYIKVVRNFLKFSI